MLLVGIASVCAIAAIASLVVRFRRSRGVERQQLKWLTFAAALMILAQPVTDYLFPASGIGTVVFGLTIACVPIAAGIAILRYRLYDIDRLINRTLVYGLLTAILGAGYVGTVLVLGQLFGEVSREPRAGPSPAPPSPWPPCSSLFDSGSRR